jgi:predicted GIY-YIG superfamily endonuclease
MSQLNFFDKLIPNDVVPENLNKRECYVYVMKARNTNNTVHKIGLSNNPHRRLKEIYKKNPVKLVNALVFPTRQIALRIEKLAHAIGDWKYLHDWRRGDGGSEFYKLSSEQAIHLIYKALSIFESLNRNVEALIDYTREVRKGKITVTL